MSYSVYLVENRAGFFLDFEHPTLQGAGAVRTLTQGVALGSELAGLSARAGSPVCPELAAPAPLKGANI